jgi:hypothetical protein
MVHYLGQDEPGPASVLIRPLAQGSLLSTRLKLKDTGSN